MAQRNGIKYSEMCLPHDKPQCVFFLSVLRTNLWTWVRPQGWHRGGGARVHKEGGLCCTASLRPPWAEGNPDSTKQTKESIWGNLSFPRWLGLDYRESIVRSKSHLNQWQKIWTLYIFSSRPKRELWGWGKWLTIWREQCSRPGTHFPVLIFTITPLSPSLASWLACISIGTGQWLKNGTGHRTASAHIYVCVQSVA